MIAQSDFNQFLFQIIFVQGVAKTLAKFHF